MATATHSYMADLRETLATLPGEIEHNVDLPALEKTVGQALTQGKLGTQILEDVLAAAPLIFPQAHYLVLAARLIGLVIKLHRSGASAEVLPATA